MLENQPRGTEWGRRKKNGFGWCGLCSSASNAFFGFLRVPWSWCVGPCVSDLEAWFSEDGSLFFTCFTSRGAGDDQTNGLFMWPCLGLLD